MVNIEFFSPYKENVAIVGMAQEGKSNLLKYLLSLNPNPYTLFDTIGVMRNLQPLKPDIQRVVTPPYKQRISVFQKTCKEVWKQGNQIFSIDEVHNFCNKYVLDPELDPIVNMGGNRNISYWITSRRVQQVHNDLLAQCKHHFIFRTYLPQDLEWYGKVVPKDVILLSKDLPIFHFIYYKLGQTPVVMKPVKDMS